MNKLTKVGCSALCGSLAAISSANAGDMTVTGSAHLTYTSLGTEVTGNPYGMQSNLTFNGSGELDNGWTFSYTVANLDGNAFFSKYCRHHNGRTWNN
jgi:outer membrane protein OmpU